MEVLLLSPTNLSGQCDCYVSTQIVGFLRAFQSINDHTKLHPQTSQPIVQFTVVVPSTDVPIADFGERKGLDKMPHVTVLHVIPQPLLKPLDGDAFLPKLLEAPQYCAAVLRHYANRHTKPNVIHAWDWSTAHVASGLALTLNTPWIFSLLNSIKWTLSRHQEGRVSALAAQLEEYGLLHSTVATQPSQFLAKIYDQALLKHKTAVIYPAVDIASAPKIKQTHHINNFRMPGRNSIKIVYSGRLSSSGNIQTILEAKLPPDVDLIVSGPEPTEEKIAHLLHQATESKERCVYYVGPVNTTTRWTMLQKARFAIVSSPSTTPTHALEVLAAHAVLITDGAGGAGELLPAKVAIQCDGTTEDYSLAFKQAAEMNDDEYNDRITQGRKLAEMYSFNYSAHSFAALYDYVNCFN